MTLGALTFLLTLLSTVGAAPTQCLSSPAQLGYNDWGMLQQNINNLTAQSTTKEATFVICPNTTFGINNNTDVTQGLIFNLAIDVPPIWIKCGDNGSSTNGCVIRGGWHHVWVQRVGAIKIQGITFEGATRGSVWTGTGSDQISFQDCIWKDNVYNWNASTSTNRCPTGCSGAVGGRDGAASFQQCQFLNNRGDSGAVYGENMAFSFDGCRFENNTAIARNLGEGTPPTGSAITLYSPGSALYLANNCFIENESHSPATVMLEDSSIVARKAFTTLRVNSNNYFGGNLVAQSNYDSIFQWCHNSIYNYIDGLTDFAYDDCVPGTANCCQCNGEQLPAAASNRTSDNSHETEEIVSSGGRPSIHSIAYLVVLAIWSLV